VHAEELREKIPGYSRYMPPEELAELAIRAEGPSAELLHVANTAEWVVGVSVPAAVEQAEQALKLASAVTRAGKFAWVAKGWDTARAKDQGPKRQAAAAIAG